MFQGGRDAGSIHRRHPRQLHLHALPLRVQQDRSGAANREKDKFHHIRQWKYANLLSNFWQLTRVKQTSRFQAQTS